MTHVNEMKRDELVDIVVEKGLVKNKTAAKKISVPELRKMLWTHHADQIDAALAEVRPKQPHVADISEADEQSDFALRGDGKGYVVKREELPEVLREPIADTAPGVRILDTQHEEPRRFPHAASSSIEAHAAVLRRRERNRRKNKKRIGRERHNAVALQAGW